MSTVARLARSIPYDVYPIVGIVTLACSIGTAASVRNLTMNKDVDFSKASVLAREETVKEQSVAESNFLKNKMTKFGFSWTKPSQW